MTHIKLHLLSILLFLLGTHIVLSQTMTDNQTNPSYSQEYEELLRLYNVSSPESSIAQSNTYDTDAAMPNTTNAYSTDGTQYEMGDMSALPSDAMYDSVVTENVTGTFLSVELSARDIIYSTKENKLFDILIKNISQNIFNIKLADDYIFNIFFEILDSNGEAVKIPSELMVKRNMGFINYRSITLYPDEEIKITVDLDDYAIIRNPDVYSIRVIFYPDMYKEIRANPQTDTKYNKYVASPHLLVSFVSLSDIEDDIEISQEKYTDIYKDTKLVVREYNPYDVIQAALTALQNQAWDTFFSYVDIVSLYTNTDSNPNVFQLLSPSDRQIEIKNFVDRIKNSSEIGELYPPNTFLIEETRYTNYNANVRVSTKTVFRSNVQNFVYNYILEKQNTGWKITNYTVQYVGIEKYNITTTLGNTTDYISPTEF